MPFLSSIKTPMAALVLVVAYSSMVIDIIGIVKQRIGSNNYPPAVVAMLVLSIVQLLHLLFIISTSGKGALNKASTVAGLTGLFAAWNLGAIIAVTVLYERADSHYCPVDSTIHGDCAGVMRGVMALGYSLLGLDLIYLGMLAAIVKSYGSWATSLHELHPGRGVNAEVKA